MGCKGKVSVSIIHSRTINHIIWSPVHGELASAVHRECRKRPIHCCIIWHLWTQVGGLKRLYPPTPPPTRNPLCLRFVQINHSNLAKREPVSREFSSPYHNISCPALWLQRDEGEERRGEKKVLLWSAMGSNGGKLTFIDTRLSEWGRAAVHFQFQPTDWNPPLGPPVSQAPFSEPMVWKTWFNSCSMLFIRFSISLKRLCVASYWRSNCASLWMVECNILW